MNSSIKLLIAILFLASSMPALAMRMKAHYYSPPETPITDYTLTSDDDSYLKVNNQTIVSNEPPKPWIDSRNGIIPNNAPIYFYENGYPRYRCRVAYDNKMYYGVLYPRNGCIISTENGSTLRFIRYEVWTLPSS